MRGNAECGGVWSTRAALRGSGSRAQEKIPPERSPCDVPERTVGSELRRQQHAVRFRVLRHFPVAALLSLHRQVGGQVLSNADQSQKPLHQLEGALCLDAALRGVG